MGLDAGAVEVLDGVVVVVVVVVVDVGAVVALPLGVRVVMGVDVLVVGAVVDEVLVLVLGVGVEMAAGAAALAVEIEHETPFRDADGSTPVPEGSWASLGVHELAERFSTRAR